VRGHRDPDARCGVCGVRLTRVDADHEATHDREAVEANVERGRQAGRDGLPLSANPYPVGTWPYGHWQNGWHETANREAA
jgi:hypothetical protein